MLKFKDSNGHVVGELSDNDSEPTLYAEDKKKAKKKNGKGAKGQLGVYQRTVIEQQDPTYIASGIGPCGNGGNNP